MGKTAECQSLHEEENQKVKGNEKLVVGFYIFFFSRPEFLGDQWQTYEDFIELLFTGGDAGGRGKVTLNISFFFHYCYSFTTLLVRTSKDVSRKSVQKIKG